MNLDSLVTQLPVIAYLVCAAGFLYFLHGYMRKNDLQAWLGGLKAAAIRAVGDEAFRREELADAEAQLAECPKPERVVPMRRNQEMFIHLLPKFLFIVGMAAVTILYFGLFHSAPEGQPNWTLYVGAALLLMTGVLFFLSEKMRTDYRRVRQLNRKYLLLKAGSDFPAMFAAIEEVLQYYPSVAELWLEYADRLAKAGRLDDAVKAIRSARDLSPGHLDLAVVELSFLIRKNDLAGADGILSAMAGMNPAPSDPRPAIYGAALALRRKNRGKAEELAAKAMRQDGAFVENFLLRDDTLAEVETVLRDKGFLQEAENETTTAQAEAAEEGAEAQG